MAARSVEKRLKDLETLVSQLQQRLDALHQVKDPWLETVCGAFANDPAFEEAMRLGREWRESHRPKPRRPRKS